MVYTVKSAQATGKVDPTYGQEFIVFFNEDPREVKLSRQNPVEVGQEEDGTIIDGKWGAYFKKTPWNGANAPAPAVAGQAKAPVKPAYKDNSDGMRQGMCFNNAANLVNKMVELTGINPEPVQWARDVFGFARALYSLGDLTEDLPPEEIDFKDAPTNVQEIFSGTPKPAVK